MSAVDKLITRIEEQAERLAGYQQLDDRRRSRIYELEGELLKAIAERDKALADVQNWREEWQGASAAGELMRAEIESLRQQLAEALALLTGQRLNAEEQDREIERLRKFADGVRTQIMRYTMSWASWNEIKSALAELDGQPAPVAEPKEGGK